MGSFVIVQAAACNSVTVFPPELPTGILLQPYSQRFDSDGVPPVSFAVTGSLPPGLTFTAADATLSGTPTQAGTYRLAVTALDAATCTGMRTYDLEIAGPTASNVFILSAGSGLPGGLVRSYQYAHHTPAPIGEDLVPFTTLFTGGARVALADLSGDGVPDPIVGAGPGGGPHVLAFDGASKAVIRSFMAYAPTFVGGLFVAAGDVNHDGIADIVTGADAGGGPHVRVVDGFTGREISSFYAYEPSFRGGVRVAAADLDGDGYAEVITGAGPGAQPIVNVFDGLNGMLRTSMMAYAPAFGGGVFVAAADVNGDGFADIITGAGAGGGPHVRVIDGVTGSEFRSFYAFHFTWAGGVAVAAADLNGDGRAEILASPAAGAYWQAVVFEGVYGGASAVVASYDPYVPGGVYPAARSPLTRMFVDQPSQNASVPGSFVIAGWALDEADPVGAGVDQVHAWAYPLSGPLSSPVFVGQTEVIRERPDVAAIFGDKYLTSGFALMVSCAVTICGPSRTLPSGAYAIAVFVRSSISGTFKIRRVVRVTVN